MIMTAALCLLSGLTRTAQRRAFVAVHAECVYYPWLEFQGRGKVWEIPEFLCKQRIKKLPNSEKLKQLRENEI